MILGRAVPTTVWSRAARKIADHHRAEDAHPDRMRQLDRRAIGDAVGRLELASVDTMALLLVLSSSIVAGPLGQFRS